MLMACGAVALPAPPAGAAEPLAAVDVERFGGSDRYETSLRVAEAVAADAGGTLDTVVLISGTNWTNAVLGAPLAAQLGGTVLATPPDRLREDAAEFLERVGVRQAWLVRADNDAAAISTDVDLALLDIGAGIEITRVSGADHYSVSAHLAITRSWHQPPGPMGALGRTVIVASGEVFADALVAGAFAARGRHPILLNPRDRLHHEVADALARIDGLEHVVLMGGESALSANVETSIEALGLDVTRIAGANRFETAAKAAELIEGRYGDMLPIDALTGAPRQAAEYLTDRAGTRCFTNRRVGLARARVPIDAFSAASLLGRRCAPLLLTFSEGIPSPTAAYLDKVRQSAATAGTPIEMYVFGDTGAVYQSAIDQYLAKSQ